MFLLYFRKYTKAKACIKRVLEKYCKKTERVEHILGIYKDPFNPYCPGNVDAQKKPGELSVDYYSGMEETPLPGEPTS